MIVDAHQHFWQVGRFDYPWMTEKSGVLYRDYLPSEPQSGVDQIVVVQASNSIAESRWLLSLADKYDFIAGVVGWVDLASANVDDQLAELTKHPSFKGVRHLAESEPADDWLVQPEVISGLQRLAAHDVTYDLLVHTRHLRHTGTVAERCPDLRLVVDHLAKPPIAKHGFKEWAWEFKPLAEFPNMYCKLSGLVTEANWNSWTVDDLRPYVECALDVFGPQRLMFGSDHPVCLLAASYQRVLESFQEIVGDEHRDLIFAENARAFYRLNNG
ncbi:MAG TPA: amidohydrolase family protein [Pyrinomonadaceae bacterium]|jgi:L-fuconolactonase|nr:amidohydrolase family protein [Pyrinomonadaceae bacterium]